MSTKSSVAMKDESTTEVRSFSRYLLWLAVSFAAFLISLNASLISTAIPSITDNFHSIHDIGWYGTAYLLADCSMQPLTGKFYQNCSMKWTFICFLSFFMVGGIICGSATSSHMLIGGRAIAGLGGSGISNGAMSIISATTPLEKRPAIVGFLMSWFGLGLILGPLLGGLITQHASWRWCFYTTVIAAGILITILVFLKIPQRHEEKQTTVKSLLKKLDLVGFILFAPTCIMLLMAAFYGSSMIYPWNSSEVIGLFCGFGGGLLCFIAWLRYAGDEAMIPTSFFKSRIIVASALTGFLQFGGQIVAATYLAIWFQAIKGASPSSSGVMILPLILSDMVLCGIGGLFTQRIGYYLPSVILGCIFSTIGSGLMITFAPSTPAHIWIGYQILVGAGRGLVFAGPILATQTHLPPSMSDTGTAVIFFTQFLGAGLFISFAQAVFSSSLNRAILTTIPGLDPAAVAAAGATGYREAFGEEIGAQLVLCWNEALQKVFIFAMAATAASLFTSVFMGWKSVKGRKQDDEMNKEGKEVDRRTADATEDEGIKDDTRMEVVTTPDDVDAVGYAEKNKDKEAVIAVDDTWGEEWRRKERMRY